MTNSSLYYGDTVLIHDAEWGDKARTAVVIADNGDGTVALVRTSTSAPRAGRPAATGTRRLSPDGRGVGNSLTATCDLMAVSRGVIAAYPVSSIRPGYRGRLDRGRLSDADMDWLDGRLDSMGWD